MNKLEKLLAETLAEHSQDALDTLGALLGEDDIMLAFGPHRPGEEIMRTEARQRIEAKLYAYAEQTRGGNDD